ncbi:hypothetical protein ACIBJI_02190 [Nocardia sp. NPDC050408]|uniref:hypothetical protein n=1 Tax=unclassified Nocardia TaxID=2637762 RepID=UPI00344419D3
MACEKVRGAETIAAMDGAVLVYGAEGWPRAPIRAPRTVSPANSCVAREKVRGAETIAATDGAVLVYGAEGWDHASWAICAWLRFPMVVGPSVCGDRENLAV